MKNIKTNKKGVLKFCNTNIREVVLNTTYTQQGHNLHFDMCSVASNICSMQCTLCTLCTVQLVYPLELSNPSWHVDTPDHYCWSTLGIVVSLTCQPELAHVPFHCGNIIQSIMLPSNDKPWSCLWNHDTGGMHPNVCYN